MYNDIRQNFEGGCFEQLLSGEWKIGLIKDNPGIENRQNNVFYEDGGILYKNERFRVFKDRVYVRLGDGSYVEGNIIYWNLWGGWFCVNKWKLVS